MASDVVIDRSETRKVVVSPRGFESLTIAPPACAIETRLWWWFDHPHRVDARRFVDELIAGSLRPRIAARDVAALPERVRARLRLAFVDALGERSCWRSLYGSPLSQDERLFALMLWRRDRLARRTAEFLAGLRRRVAKTSAAQVDRGSLVGKVMASMERRDRMLASTSVLDRRFSALDTALGRTGKPARSPFEKFGSATGFASGLFGHRRDELMRPVGVSAFLDDSAGVRGFSKVARAVQLQTKGPFGVDISKRIGGVAGIGSERFEMFGLKGAPTILGKLARGEGGLAAGALTSALGEHSKFARGVALTLGLSGTRAGLSEDIFGRVAGFDAAGIGTAGSEQRRRSLLFAGAFKDVGFAGGYKAGAPPWFSKLSGAFLPGLSDRKFVITGNLGAAFPDFGKLAPRHLEALQRWEAQAALVSAFERQWEQDALWYLLYHLEVRFLARLAPLERAEVEDAVLDALEGAVRDEGFSAALQEGVGHATMLNSSQRRHLQHALQHAQAGEWVDASPPLMSGLEGAFWATARERSVINPDRTRTDNPKKLIKGVESVVKLVVSDAEFSLFIRSRVFGTTGNPYRHGDADGGERRQVLLGIAALCGWVDSFVGLPALPVLSAELNEQMPDAFDRADERRLTSGD